MKYRKQFFRRDVVPVLSLLLLPAQSIEAKSQEADAGAVALPTIEINAARLGRSPESLTRNVTFISRDEIQRQLPTAQSLADVLGKLVPGMAPASGVFTTFNQTLRGRDALVVIDGVPQKLNRNASRDIFNVPVLAIESIEVVHGGSALYGGGAAGGIIYIKTLSGGGEPRFKTRFSLGSSLTHLGSDALFGDFEQTAEGSVGATSYAFGVSGGLQGGAFDARGRRIAPKPSQGDLYDSFASGAFGRLRHDFGDQEIGASFLFRGITQDSNYGSDPSVARFAPGTVAARALKGLELDEQGSLYNLQGTLSYSHQNVLGSRLETQFYARNYETLFYPFDARKISTQRAILQNGVESRVYGGNATFDTPLPSVGAFSETRLLWGADFELERTAGPAKIYDGTAFDRSGGLRFVNIGQRIFMPPTQFGKYGLYAQIETKLFDRVTIRGGFREQWATINVDDYTTIVGIPIQGGGVDYATMLPNIGATFAVTDNINLYADYSRSFDLSDVGLQLRLAPKGFRFSNSDIKPLIYDNFEVGARGNWNNFNASVALFYSTSDVGALRVENFALVQERDPERIRGIEMAASYTINDQWRVGGTATLMEGERQDQALGRWVALNGFRIPPVKLTGYVEYQPTDWWSLRVQALYSGTRVDAFHEGVGFGGRKVEDYAEIDLYSSFKLSRGQLEIGVKNALNSDHYNVYAQLLRNSNNTSHVPSSGATVKAAYTLTW